MFEAFLLVCAASLSEGVDINRCLLIKDNFGPFRTEENCRIRVDQMANEMIVSNPLNQFFIFESLGFPEYLVFTRNCEQETI